MALNDYHIYTPIYLHGTVMNHEYILFYLNFLSDGLNKEAWRSIREVEEKKKLKSQKGGGKRLIFPCTNGSTDNTNTSSPTPCHDLRYYLRQEERKRWLMSMADRESENQSTAQLSHVCWPFSSRITGKVWWLLQWWWNSFWKRHPLRWQIRLMPVPTCTFQLA